MQRRYDLRRSDNYMYTGKISYVCSGSGQIYVYTGFPVTRAMVSWTTYPFAQDEAMSSSSSSSSLSSTSLTSMSETSQSIGYYCDPNRYTSPFPACSTKFNDFSNWIVNNVNRDVSPTCRLTAVIDGTNPLFQTVRILVFGGSQVLASGYRLVSSGAGTILLTPTTSAGVTASVQWDGVLSSGSTNCELLSLPDASSESSSSSLDSSSSTSSSSTEIKSSSGSSSTNTSVSISESSSSSLSELPTGLPRLYVQSYSNTGFTVVYENIPPQVGFIEFSFSAV